MRNENMNYTISACLQVQFAGLTCCIPVATKLVLLPNLKAITLHVIICFVVLLVWTSYKNSNWGKPEWAHDNGPRVRNNGLYLSVYVSITPRLSHPDSWDLHVRPEMLCVFRYIDVRGLQLSIDWTARTTGATRVCHEDYRWRECADTWYKQIQSTETVHGAVSARQLANTPVWIKNNRWAYPTAVLCRRSCQQRHDTELTSVCMSFVNVEPYGLYNSAETSLALLHMYNIISSGSPPVFLECTSIIYNVSPLLFKQNSSLVSHVFTTGMEIQTPKTTIH